jgi:predicted DNA-binding transcriptional regulator YafY
MAQKYKPQQRRLTYIDREIGSGSYPNCSKLANGWEVSAKTIQRDIDYLRYEIEAPIEYSPKHRGFYYRERSWRLPAIPLSEGDLFFMSVADSVLEQYANTPLRETLRCIFDKIRQALPEKISIPVEFLPPGISVRSAPMRVIKAEVWRAVAASLRNNRSMEIEFRTAGHSSFVRRIVDPYHMFAYWGEWYLIAGDRERHEPKLYALSRIKSADSLEEHFTVPKDFDVKRYMSGAFGVFRGERSMKVRLRFNSSKAPYILDRTWMEGQEVKTLKDGQVVLSFETSHLHEVERWVLSWGDGVKVLNPKELVQSVTGMLKRAARAYV